MNQRRYRSGTRRMCPAASHGHKSKPGGRHRDLRGRNPTHASLRVCTSGVLSDRCGTCFLPHGGGPASNTCSACHANRHKQPDALSGVKGRDVAYRLREFQPGDAAAVNEVALAAFQEIRHHYDDCDAFSRVIGDMASLAETAALIVATVQGAVAGAVAYVAPGKKKSGFFPVERPFCACSRSRRPGAPLIALHTTPIMGVALPLYERMGFRYGYEAPDVFGVPYGICTRQLADQQGVSADA
jgi:hypothetical protein